jgi:flagellar basal-body rod protein FlgB
MAINLDRLANLHHSTVTVRNQQMQVAAENLANANTPGYKARAINFDAALQKVMKNNPGTTSVGMTQTQSGHLQGKSQRVVEELAYQVPLQPDTGDGNTVDAQRERSQFLDTAMRYQASLQFLGGKFKSLKKAFGGGQQ